MIEYKNQKRRYGMAWPLCAALWLVCAALVAGCGQSVGLEDNTAGVGTGGTGGSTGITKYSLASTATDSSLTNTVLLTGTVADGSLANATVFLDKNNNYQLDEGEPSTTTGADGAYILPVHSSDIGVYPLVALAIKGVTLDKGTNLTVANDFALSAPKERVGIVGGTAITLFVAQPTE